MDINKLSSDVIKAAISVHKELGPGLLETVYQICMNIALTEMGINVATEVAVPIRFRGREITEQGFRMDLLVEDTIVVELKSIDKVKDVHKKQLLTYLKLTGKPLGLLINFNEPLVKDGITRVINKPAGFTDPGCLSRVFTLAGLKGSVKKTLSLCALCLPRRCVASYWGER